MLVLVQDAAEAVSSSDLEASDLAGVDARFGQRV
jgi:hypothetical protein